MNSAKGSSADMDIAESGDAFDLKGYHNGYCISELPDNCNII